MPIQQLSPDVVAKIAAGEVIERPASVVKELVENAIDAGARTVRVSLRGDGREEITISDDGMGIIGDEVELAFARHATSKLSTAEDLFNIQTLGFRGEALASVASVSHIRLSTRNEYDTAGTEIRVIGGEIAGRRPVGLPRGTTIRVEHLFYNTPARLKFMKKEMTEKRHIAGIISRYAMAYPHIRFMLEQDGHEVFRTNATGSLIDVVASALGIEQVRDMLEVSDSSGAVTVYGYSSAPRLNRSDRSRITLFVNGRWVQDTGLTYAVVQAYHTLLMTGRFPIAVLMITVPPSDVDVNVHPTKAEVRFRDSDAVFGAVQRAVRRAIIEQGTVPGMRSRAYDSDNGPMGEIVTYTDQRSLDLSLETPGQFARHRGMTLREESDPTAIPEGMGMPERPRTLPLLRLVGQIASSYIVTEGPAGMYLIDQHAAHERILFEQYMAEYSQRGTLAQYALEAQTVQVAPDEARLLDDHRDVLMAIGFDLESFGPNTFVIRSVPAALTSVDPVTAIAGILDDLAMGQAPGAASIEEQIILRVCKSAAVKAGQVLSSEQMQGLIQQLERCAAPLTCPHGRPTLIHMSNAQLEKQFGRVV